MKVFSERLKELRTQYNLSLKELSKKTGLSQTALSYWENQQRIPNAHAVVVLSRFFKVSTDFLLGEENDAN